MFVDASALVAILLGEPEAEAFALKILDANRPVTSPIALFEAAAALCRVHACTMAKAQEMTSNLLAELRTEIISITPRHGEWALAAFERFDKGRHAARLNMGDCFAYAIARAESLPLLYKGNDFSRTDIASAHEP